MDCYLHLYRSSVTNFVSAAWDDFILTGNNSHVTIYPDSQNIITCEQNKTAIWLLATGVYFMVFTFVIDGYTAQAQTAYVRAKVNENVILQSSNYFYTTGTTVTLPVFINITDSDTTHKLSMNYWFNGITAGHFDLYLMHFSTNNWSGIQLW